MARDGDLLSRTSLETGTGQLVANNVFVWGTVQMVLNGSAKWYSSLWETHVRAWERHMLYGITETCHPTQVNAPHHNPSDLPTPEGWKAELTLVSVIYRDGLPVGRPVVTT